MTISTTDSRISYIGNGVTTDFAFPYRFFENADLVVESVDAAGTVTTHVLNTDYTVAGADLDAGGTVTMVTPPASGERLVIRRVVEATQETDYISGDPFPAESHERALDRLTMLVQQNQEVAARALVIPSSDTTGTNVTLPRAADRADKVIRFDSAGNVGVSSIGSLGGPVSDSSQVAYLPAGTGAQQTTVQAKLRESVSVNDFSSSADAIANIPLLGKIVVPNGGTTTPISAAGKNILWEYDQGGDSDNVIDADGNRGGFFADYDCKAGKVLVYQVREDQSAIAGGGFRDLLFLNTVDNDTTNYTAVGQKCTYGVRSYVQGAYVSGAYQSQYKDLVGGEFYAIGNIQWDDRGCSGITAAAVQYGSGIASNEFSVQNPASGAAGGVEQSLSMAAIQPIIRAQFADEDATHLVRGVLVTNVGRRATAGVEILSSTAEGYSGHYKYGLQMANAIVTDAAIQMPQSASGNSGTVIVYDPNDYSVFDRAENRFSWVVGGSVPLSLTATGVGVGAQISNAAQTRLQINASTSALSHLQLIAGATPTLPNNGEIWFDGTAVKIVIGGVVRTFTVV